MRVFYGMLGVFVFLSCTLSVRASDDYYTNLKKRCEFWKRISSI